MVGSMVGYLTAAQEDVRSLYKVGLSTSRLLLALGDLVVGWLLLRQADVALTQLAGRRPGRDKCLLQGQGRRGEVLRPDAAAAADRPAGDRRGRPT